MQCVLYLRRYQKKVFQMTRHCLFYFTALLLLLTNSAIAQIENNAPDNSSNQGDTTILQSTAIVDTIQHLYNMDSLDKAQKKRESADLLKIAALQAETDKIWMKKQIGALSARNMRGRGYVKGGIDSAAIYILKKYKEFKLKPVGANGAFTQGFAFPVNTFPGKMKLSLNGDQLKPGIDYVIDPASPSFTGSKLPVKTINLNDIADRLAWKYILSQFDGSHAYLLQNADLFCSKILYVKRNVFLASLPAGVYLLPQNGILQWGISRDTIAATVFCVHPDVLPKNLKSLSAEVVSEFIPRARNVNIVGCVPGAVTDSYIVFSAHYDHLGMMGDTTMFPGASDNASGVAMMLNLASFYIKHPPHYTIVFIAFSGEEASLMGSEFFVKNPMFPLKKIRFLINMDVMGDASNALTVVNATENQEEYGLLKKINDKEKFVPELRSRGPAANSDHYYFAKAGVPAFFIYSNGGKGYYHDIYDKAKEITANNLDGVAKLLITFARELN